MRSENDTPSLGATVACLSAALLKLDSGAIARLRHMNIDGPGELDFWNLAVKCSLRTNEAGMRFVKIMAMLVPAGEPGQRGVLHSFKHPLGETLCDTGISETRLARFLALPFQSRGPALERMAKWIAARRDPGNGIDCADIACLLFSDDVKYLRKLAETYYRRLDTKRIDTQEESAA
jgi:CRISPR system Cascade subunit CasB